MTIGGHYRSANVDRNKYCVFVRNKLRSVYNHYIDNQRPQHERNMSEHTQEPWQAFHPCAYRADGKRVFELEEAMPTDYLRRIVACVNACQGISTERLESWLNPPEGMKGAPDGTWAKQLLELWAEASAACVQRDNVLAALEAATHALRSYQYGNDAPDLAKDVADKADAVIANAKGGA